MLVVGTKFLKTNSCISCYDFKANKKNNATASNKTEKNEKESGNSYRENSGVTHGVPQGSTLGPLLFLIYINDLPKVSNLKVRLFADDAILTLSDKDEKNLQHIMNNQLTKIDDWMKINQFTTSYKKTNFMIFTRKKKISSPLSISIGQNRINHKTNVKYLGVVIDEKMSWKNHVNYLCSKLAKGCWAISTKKLC